MVCLSDNLYNVVFVRLNLQNYSIITDLAHPKGAMHCPFGNPCSISCNIQHELPGDF